MKQVHRTSKTGKMHPGYGKCKPVSGTGTHVEFSLVNDQNGENGDAGIGKENCNDLGHTVIKFAVSFNWMISE
jgi:hypothetical protein